jgi:hypothetical protein
MRSNISNRLLMAGLSLTALVCSGPVAADMPPPVGYVEQCTVEKQQGANETCVASSRLGVSDPPGTREASAKKLEARGYVYRCRTSSVSFWKEVWCKSNKPRGTKEPAPHATAMATGTLIGLSSAVVLAGALAALAIRRRRNQP